MKKLVRGGIVMRMVRVMLCAVRMVVEMLLIVSSARAVVERRAAFLVFGGVSDDW